MQTSITTRHGDTTQAIEEYVREKTARFSRYFDRISSVQIIMDRQRNEHTVECIVSVDHGENLISHAGAIDLYAAIDQCADRTIRQLTDLKSRLRDHKHERPGSGAPE